MLTLLNQTDFPTTHFNAGLQPHNNTLWSSSSQVDLFYFLNLQGVQQVLTKGEPFNQGNFYLQTL